MPETIKCSNKECGTTINTEGVEIGETVECPKCGTPNQVLAQFGTEFQLDGLAPLKVGERISHPGRLVCTNCGAVLGVRDATCPSCGGDVRTGFTRMRITADEKKRGGLGRFFISAGGKGGSRVPVAPLVIGGILLIVLVVLVVLFLSR